MSDNDKGERADASITGARVRLTRAGSDEVEEYDLLLIRPCSYCGEAVRILQDKDGDYAGLHDGDPCKPFMDMELDEFLRDCRLKDEREGKCKVLS